MLNVPAYVLSKKYTEDSLIGVGALKGAPCKIKSIVKQNGQNIITFGWTDDLGDEHESVLYVDDGTPIYQWESGYSYEYGDLVIYESSFYRCIVANSDATFDETHWNGIGSPDGNYDIVEKAEDLPARFTSADRKMYFNIEEGIFYLWNGSEWEPQRITEQEIDDLFL